MFSLSSILNWLRSTLSNLSILSWYSFSMGCILVLCMLSHLIYCLFSRWHSTTRWVLRYLIYPHVIPRLPLIGAATRFEALLVFLYLLANILFVAVGVKAEIDSRAAMMAIMNLIPLLCGSRLSLVTKLLGISLRSSISTHQWLGRTAFAQILVHMVIRLGRVDTFTWTTKNLTGVVARFQPTWVASR